MKAACLALSGLLSLATATGAASDEATLRLGHAIFTGAIDLIPESRRDTLPARQLSRFACANCHGRDGSGGTEGEAPPIYWSALTTPTPLRGGYDDATFHNAVTSGHTSDGRTLSRLMPRYPLDPSATAALAAYLVALPQRDRRGVTPNALDFCVLTASGAETRARAYAAILAKALLDLAGEGGLYGRYPNVITLEGTPEQMRASAEAQCLAVVGLPAVDNLPLKALTDRGVPVLFPLAHLSGREDHSITRSLRPTRRDVLAALVRDLGAQSPPSIHLLGDEESKSDLERMLRLDPATTDIQVTDGSDGPPPPNTALVALGPVPADMLAIESSGQQFWFLSQDFGMQDIPDGVATTVMIEAPGLVSFALGADLGPQEAHAKLAAEVLTAALKVAGRDVGRAGLLRALDMAALGHLGLDYETVPLSGTRDVLPLRLGPAN